MFKKGIKLIIVGLVLILLYNCFFNNFGRSKDKPLKNKEMYVGSEILSASLYDENINEVDKITRGNIVTKLKDKKELDGKKYNKIKYNNKEYYINYTNLVDNKEEIVQEQVMYVRTPVTIYKDLDSIEISSHAKKGTELKIVGYDKLLEDGTVSMYKLENGYVYGKYLVNNKEEALKNYDENGLYLIHAKRKDAWGGGSADNLDYYPYDKPKFENNVMPKEVRSLYVDVGNIYHIDEYINLAKESGINAIVVDIKDGIAGYPAKAMEKYSISQYKHAVNKYENYRNAIKKVKDSGLYVIGRITTFKDSYYAKDHPENAILNTSDGKPYRHDGSYWPSAFNREVWEFNVALAIESVKEMGFNEIQFDYVRFPDRVTSLEREGKINYNNKYNESKAQAIQNFVMYACDEIHKYGAYVSIDVFGEAAHNYVTAYGQYWPSISNVADVISGMPYPDHFSKYEYGFKEPVWTIPYQLLNTWGKSFVMKRQEEIPTPAVVRTWIQAYNTIREPFIVYDENMIAKQIQGLYDAGLTGGFITWNGASSIGKYRQISNAFGKEY